MLVMDFNQKEILKSYHLEIINTVDLKNSFVLDHLIEDEILSSGEQEEILSERTLREQNTKLLFIVKRRKGPFDKSFNSLIRALEDEYSFLAEKLKTDSRACNSAVEGGLESQYKCVYCLLLENLIPRDVTHQLYQKDIISDDELQILNEHKSSRKKSVIELLQLIQTSKTESAEEIFISILEKKYAFVTERLQKQSSGEITRCSCTNSQVKESAMMCLSLQNRVGKSFPNNIRIMKKCAKLWNMLFDVREKGDWEKFSEITTKGLKSFQDSDLQLMLCRADVCRWTFYKNEPSKACTMFDKAMEILPTTCMPNWHLARLLPLKVEILSKSRNFDEASKLLKDSHQTIATLEPCLSTGAVYFFEGMFLGEILRQNRGGTRSKSIRSRVIECFLTAIDHYERERFFAIESFSNQTYLFLSLFCLGVDFKQIRYMFPLVTAKDDVEMAKHYLDKFEEVGWEKSTNWSQMLFYIARAEEHKNRNNFRRSVEYFNQAQHCADIGAFKDHEQFIKYNIDFLSEKLEEEISQQKTPERSTEEILNKFLQSSEESNADSEV